MFFQFLRDFKENSRNWRWGDASVAAPDEPTLTKCNMQSLYVQLMWGGLNQLLFLIYATKDSQYQALLPQSCIIQILDMSNYFYWLFVDYFHSETDDVSNYFLECIMSKPIISLINRLTSQKRLNKSKYAFTCPIIHTMDRREGNAPSNHLIAQPLRRRRGLAPTPSSSSSVGVANASFRAIFRDNH